MIALIILPLLLVFTLIDFDGGGDDDSDETDATAGDLDVASLLNVIELTEGDDEYTGNNQLNEVDGLGGDDRLLGLGGTDYLEGGAGNDVVRGADGADVLGGSAGQDRLIGADGNDILLGGDGNDSLEGQEGNDVIYGGAGADTLLGGTGDDFLYSFQSDGIDPAADNLRAPALNVEHFNAFDAVAFARPELTAQEIETILSAQGFGEEDLPVSEADGQKDILNGGRGTDLLFLGAGDDGTGGANADSFIVTTGNSRESAANVLDFNSEEDVIIVNHLASSVPVITVLDVTGDAHVLADGSLLAVVANAAGNVSVSDVRLVQST